MDGLKNVRNSNVEINTEREEIRLLRKITSTKPLNTVPLERISRSPCLKVGNTEVY